MYARMGFRQNPALRAVLKPGTATSIVYVPTTRPDAEKRPVASVDAVVRIPVKSFLILTLAPGITFPLGSSTLPDIVAVLPIVCPCNCREHIMQSNTHPPTAKSAVQAIEHGYLLSVIRSDV